MDITCRTSRFNKKGIRVSYGYMNDKDLEILDGRYIEYYPNSESRRVIISFDKGRPYLYKEFHSNGKEKIIAETDRNRICTIRDPKVKFHGQYMELDDKGQVVKNIFINGKNIDK